LRSIDSLPALHFVLSVNLTRLDRLNPLLALFLVRLVDSLRTLDVVLARLVCLNLPAVPLLM
jgi:hypothetical protein